MSPSIVISDLHFAWPDGAVVFDGLDVVLPAGVTALVGRNGAGKSTLLKVLRGQLRPTRGSVSAPAPVAYLPQDIVLDATRTISDVLGASETRAALARIEEGTAAPSDFDAVGSDWDIDERCLALLSRLGLPITDLDRRLGAVSGGEATLLALAGLLLSDPATLLLDEPTNNLDAERKQYLYRALAEFRGAVVVVSHDLELLERVDATAELRDGEVRLFGGPYSLYREVIDAEQQAAREQVADAKNNLRKQRGELIEAQTKVDRRAKYGKQLAANSRAAPIVLGMWKRQAQESAGKLRGGHQADVAKARDALTDAEALLREDDVIRIDVPESVVPSRREVLSCPDLEIVGPERIGIVGRNGAGKTTMLRRILASEGLRVPAAYLPQRLDLLDDDRTLAEAVADAAPEADQQDVRAHLARLLFRGRAGDKTIGSLSGGERLRAALAVVLFRRPTPQLLVLDEPTNNLDLDSVESLATALAGWPGALVIVSHDEGFLERVGLDRRVEL